MGYLAYQLCLPLFLFEIETIVDDVGLVVKTGMGPTKGKLKQVLTISKLDIPPKIGVLLGIHTLGKLTGAKSGANVAGDDNINEKTRELTIQTVGGSDEVTATVDNSVTEDVT